MRLKTRENGEIGLQVAKKVNAENIFCLFVSFRLLKAFHKILVCWYVVMKTGCPFWKEGEKDATVSHKATTRKKKYSFSLYSRYRNRILTSVNTSLSGFSRYEGGEGIWIPFIQLRLFLTILRTMRLIIIIKFLLYNET